MQKITDKMEEPRIMKAEKDLSLEYKKLAMPIIGELMAGHKVMRVFGRGNEICHVLEKNCEIDYLLEEDQTGEISGVSSVVEYGKGYRAFTVERLSLPEETEELQAGYLAQINVEDGEIAGVCLVRREDLADFVEAGLAYRDPTQGENMYVCDWDEMRENGYELKEYSKKAVDSEPEEAPDAEAEVELIIMVV